MPIEPWWETNPATTPRQELGMVSPELLTPGNSLELPDKYSQGLFDVPVKPRYYSPNRVRDSDLASDRTAQPWGAAPGFVERPAIPPRQNLCRRGGPWTSRRNSGLSLGR